MLLMRLTESRILGAPSMWVTPAVLLAKKAHFSFSQVSLCPLVDLAGLSSFEYVSFEERL